jgi:hypothetical protein
MFSVLVANVKGGCGKTTVATNLAAAFASTRKRASLADVDRQRSSLGWVARRPKALPAIAAIDWVKEIGDRLTAPIACDRLASRDEGEAGRKARPPCRCDRNSAPSRHVRPALDRTIPRQAQRSQGDRQAPHAGRCHRQPRARRGRRSGSTRTWAGSVMPSLPVCATHSFMPMSPKPVSACSTCRASAPPSIAASGRPCSPISRAQSPRPDRYRGGFLDPHPVELQRLITPTPGPQLTLPHPPDIRC